MTIIILPPPPGAPAAIRAVVELLMTDGPLAGLRLTGLTIEDDGPRVTWPAVCHWPTFTTSAPPIVARILAAWTEAQRAALATGAAR